MEQEKYFCPLCKQEVSKQLYDKITGVWKEKEKHLAALKVKEAALFKKEKDLLANFEKQKAKIAQQASLAAERKFSMEKRKIEASLAVERKNLLAEMKKGKMALAAEKRNLVVERDRLQQGFQQKLAAATNKALRAAAAEQKKANQAWKLKMDTAVKNALEMEKKRIDQDKKKSMREVKLQQDRNSKLLKQYSSLQGKYQQSVDQANKKIRSLEEQVRKNQTPQVLGLLEENVFLEELKKRFPDDAYLHTGKGGDIVHTVMHKGQKAGMIVYELKKVQTFQNAHVEQALKAKMQREADYAILVTNAKSGKEDPGFSVRKGVIVIHPAAAPVLIGILREQLIALSSLRLGKEERDQAVRSVLEYLQGPNFRNAVGTVVRDTLDLYEDLRKEVQGHLKTWHTRLEKYREIHQQATNIEGRVGRLIENKGDEKKRITDGKIAAIELPEKIN